MLAAAVAFELLDLDPKGLVQGLGFRILEFRV